VPVVGVSGVQASREVPLFAFAHLRCPGTESDRWILKPRGVSAFGSELVKRMNAARSVSANAEDQGAEFCFTDNWQLLPSQSQARLVF
jgi:hypothetical protein